MVIREASAYEAAARTCQKRPASRWKVWDPRLSERMKNGGLGYGAGPLRVDFEPLLRVPERAELYTGSWRRRALEGDGGVILAIVSDNGRQRGRSGNDVFTLGQVTPMITKFSVAGRSTLNANFGVAQTPGRKSICY
ncbi:hypothetical protein B0H13DRAFT_1857605 [Mycena leptocephala]|nr:hypothetical protein B0H13DRAFT_1857605 [Mycena leptocephala]